MGLSSLDAKAQEKVNAISFRKEKERQEEKEARQKMIDVLIGCVIGWVAHIAWTKWGSLLVDLNDK